MGTTGPASLAADGKPWGMRFPVITIRDMVRAQIALLDALGIAQLHAVVGGSMGGMQALSFAANWPERTRAALVIASTARHSAQNIAFHEVGRQAIRNGTAAITAMAKARRTVSQWRGWRRTSLTSPKSRCTRSSGASCRTVM
jgi:homoserine O-acetyltransferase